MTSARGVSVTSHPPGVRDCERSWTRAIHGPGINLRAPLVIPRDLAERASANGRIRTDKYGRRFVWRALSISGARDFLPAG